MRITTATGVTGEPGPLVKIVDGFTKTQSAILAAGVKSTSDWDPILAFIDPDRFKRVGAYLEEFDWTQYREFLSGWASGGTRFERTVFYVTEVGDTVFREIEERHYRGEEFIRKNVMAVFRFNAENRIIHLQIYEQALDSGQWIKDAAEAATSAAE
jgi:hypothetical protein